MDHLITYKKICWLGFFNITTYKIKILANLGRISYIFNFILFVQYNYKLNEK